MLAINTKMKLTKDKLVDFENMIYNKKVIIMPQTLYMPFFSRGNYILGAQDVSKYNSGEAFTGEISAKDLKDIGCKYVMVGHSERKYNFNESLSDLRNKVQNVIDNDMIPVYCIDQTEDDLKNDPEMKNIELQLEALPEFLIHKYVIIVFEPSYIIGKTDMVPDKENLSKVINKIKTWMFERHINHGILYGGGVSPSNVEDLMSVNGIDGTIICSCAFNEEDFNYIYKVCVENKS